MDGLKINHLKTQTMHVCNTKLKTECSSVYLYIAITIHNIHCYNFYLLLSHYYKHAVL